MICGCYTGHHFPSSPPALFRGLGLACGGWRILWVVTAQVMGHSAMTGINETCMGNENTKRLQGKKTIKEDYQVRAFTSSLPHLNIQPDQHSQHWPAWMVTWQLCDLICGVWDTQYSQWRQVHGKKRHLPSCFFISCGVSLKRKNYNL